jgi:hypothetical protein
MRTDRSTVGDGHANSLRHCRGITRVPTASNTTTGDDPEKLLIVRSTFAQVGIEVDSCHRRIDYFN